MAGVQRRRRIELSETRDHAPFHSRLPQLARDADRVWRWRQGGLGPILAGPKAKGQPFNRLPRFVVQDPSLPGSRVQEKRFRKSLGLGSGNRDHLIASDLRLLRPRARRRDQNHSEQHDRLLHGDGLSRGVGLRHSRLFGGLDETSYRFRSAGSSRATSSADLHGGRLAGHSRILALHPGRRRSDSLINPLVA